MLTRRSAWWAAIAGLWARPGAAQVLRPPGGGGTPGGGSVTVGVANLVANQTPGGTPDGSRTAFTLAHTPAAGTLTVYRNGLRQKPGADYTLAGNTVTFVAEAVPQTDDLLLADYWR